eukprot:5048171-Prymnesium_polylepis.1
MSRSGRLRVGMAHPCTILRAGRAWHHALFPSRLDRRLTRCIDQTVASRWHASDTTDVASDAALDGHADVAIGIVPQQV